ncbi:unnamed protein product, partial [Effrenium voratum]
WENCARENLAATPGLPRRELASLRVIHMQQVVFELREKAMAGHFVCFPIPEESGTARDMPKVMPDSALNEEHSADISLLEECPKRSKEADWFAPLTTTAQGLMSFMSRSTGGDPSIKASKVDSVIRKQREARTLVSLRLLHFLERNRFKQTSVNSRKTSTWGFSHTYPLHEAAKQNDTYIVRCLLRFGANPSNKDSSGRTALEIVKALPTHSEVCYVLEEARTKSSQILLRGFEQFMKDVEQRDPLAKGKVRRA